MHLSYTDKWKLICGICNFFFFTSLSLMALETFMIILKMALIPKMVENPFEELH